MIRQFIGRAFRAMWYFIDYLDTMPRDKFHVMLIGFGIMAIAIAGLIHYFLKKRG